MNHSWGMMVFYATMMTVYALAAGYVVAILSATAWDEFWARGGRRWSASAQRMLQHTGKVAATTYILTAIAIYVWAYS